MIGPALAKKPAPTLLAAVRRFVANGGTWGDFVHLVAPEFGGVPGRHGEITGWVMPPGKERKR